METEKQSPVFRTIDRLSRYALALSGIFVLAMAFASTYGVGRRYLLRSPEPYSYEVCTILLIWCFVLAMAAIQMQQRHIRGDFVLSRLPRKVQYVIDYLLAPLLGLLCAVLLTWKGIPGATFSLSIGEVSSSAWKEPVFPVKIVIVIGYGFLALVTLYQVYRGFARLRSQMSGQKSGPGSEQTQAPAAVPAKEGPDGR